MPILFFGDLERYKHAGLRVITVGLNPSHLEFPENNPFERFRQMEGLEQGPSNYGPYIRSLSRYFEGQRYNWFDNYEDVLSGLKVSYRQNNDADIALHTDICSPLATRKPWRRLDRDTKMKLKKGGRPLWEDLMGYLRPQLILAQVGYHEHLKKLGAKQNWQGILVPKNIVGTKTEIRLLERKFNGQLAQIVYWKPIRPTFGKPFADLSPEQRKSVGKFIRREICPRISGMH